MIYRSSYPDVVIPAVTLADYVFEHVDAWLDAPALIEGPTGRAVTYRELRTLIARVSAALSARRFGEGDALCLYSPNIPEYAAVFLGVSRVGGMNTTANPLYTAGELERQLRDSGARLVVTVPALAERALEASRGIAGATVIVFGQAPGCIAFDDFLAAGDAHAVPAFPIDPSRSIVALPYSSGTTGLPKGVMLSHRNLVANLAQIDGVEVSGPGDHVVCVLPFFHIYGLVVVLLAVLRKGACVVAMPHFDLEQFLALSQRYRTRSAYLVPPIVLALAKHPIVDKYDLSALKAISSGAAPLGAELESACAARFGCIVKQGYGMTEASPVTHFTPNDASAVRHGSCGVLIANTECRVVDMESRADCPPGVAGELYIRGPQVMAGYLNNPEATAEAIDADGWLHTGDVGYTDADGYFYIVDRLKEFIKYKGYQVAPAELEAIIIAHPAVADVAVIPMRDEEAGEVPKACVVARSPLGAEEVMAYVAERVAPFKKVRAVEFVEKIPRSSAGKILRRELIARERERERENARGGEGEGVHAGS